MRRALSNLNSQSGSAMVFALTAVALLGLMVSATMTVAGVMATDANRKSQAKLVQHFIGSLETIATNAFSCKGTSASPSSNLRGLLFNPTNSTTRPLNLLNQTCPNDSTCLQRGVGAGKLHVALDTNLGGAVRRGAEFTNQGVRVDDFYLTELQITTVASTVSASGRLMIQLSTTNPEVGFAPREVGRMNLSFDSAAALTFCNSTPSARSLCESMDCVYNPTVPDGVQRCSCGFPVMACPPGEYISGVTSSGSEICTRVELNCATTHGAGYFFAGIDSAGQPICLAVEGTIGSPTTTCPAGTSTSNSGGESSTTGCFCPSGQLWNSSTSSCYTPTTAVNGACGTAHGGSFSTAPTTNLCSAGTTTGATDNGSGSWVWTCNGSGGGTNAGCSATKTITVTGCYFDGDGHGQFTIAPGDSYYGAGCHHSQGCSCDNGAGTVCNSTIENINDMNFTCDIVP